MIFGGLVLRNKVLDHRDGGAVGAGDHDAMFIDAHIPTERNRQCDMMLRVTVLLPRSLRRRSAVAGLARNDRPAGKS